MSLRFASLIVGIGFLALSSDASALTGPLCPSVTCTGGAPNINYGSGGLSHAEIVPIFWGSYWNTGTNPSRAQIVAQIQWMANGAYFGALNQYGGTANTVGPVRMVPTAPIYTGKSVPSPKCSDGSACTIGGAACADGSKCNVHESAIEPGINDAIGKGLVPGPTPNTDMLYVVFLPPGSMGDAYNSGGSCASSCGSAYNGDSYKTAVNDGTGSIAHELVEAISDNVSFANCTYNSSGGKANQTADLCDCYHDTGMAGTNNEVKLPAYWSQKDGECVIPEGWNGLWAYDFVGWNQVYSGTMRQAYAGGFGVVVTDTNDNLISLAGSIPTQIGGPSAMFAVGDDAVYALTTDAGGVWKYTTSSGWTSIGGPASSILAGGHMIATGFDGSPWLYSNSTWTEIGGPNDQYVVNAAGLVSLTMDHKSVWLDANATLSGWTQIGGSADELFAGKNTMIAKTELGSTKNIQLYSGSGTNWSTEGGPGNTFACTVDGLLYGLTPSRGNIFEDVSGSWTSIGGAAGKLVQKTDQTGYIYATGTVVY